MALNFASGAYLLVPANVTNPINLKIAGDLTVLFWYKSTTSGPQHIFYANHTGTGGSGYNVGQSLNTSAHIAMQVNGGVTEETLSGGSLITSGTYRSIAIVIVATVRVDFYIDNVLINSPAIGVTPGQSQTTDGIGIAANPGGGGPATCVLSHLTVINRAATPTEIGRFHNCEDSITIFGSNVMGYWKMPGGESPVVDSSTNLYHATIPGAAPTTDTDPPGYSAGPAGPPSVYVIFEG